MEHRQWVHTERISTLSLERVAVPNLVVTFGSQRFRSCSIVRPLTTPNPYSADIRCSNVSTCIVNAKPQTLSGAFFFFPSQRVELGDP